ncbi:MAG TPA: ABC transporter permease [Acidimicrobiales bacterium]|nr:ABC transporter permease [Acidimicrobiales bacterium]
MTGLIVRKLASLIPVLLAVSFLTFMMLSLLPGCLECQILGPENLDSEQVAAVREDLRLDDPLPVRYVAWLGDAFSGDLGRSYYTRQEVFDAIVERLPVTIEIVIVSMAMSLVVSIPLGMATAYRSGGLLDRSVTGATFGLLAIPNFMMGLLLIYLFAVQWGLLPSTGWTAFTEDPFENLRAVFLPSLALATGQIAVFTRLLRTDMIATLQEDHVLLARAKGLSTWRILLRHALRPSSFSLLTVSALTVGALLGGAVIVEQLFALPGIGRLLFDAIFQRDLLVVQGVVLVITVGFVLINALVDILYVVLDPRLRTGSMARG